MPEMCRLSLRGQLNRVFAIAANKARAAIEMLGFIFIYSSPHWLGRFGCSSSSPLGLQPGVDSGASPARPRASFRRQLTRSGAMSANDPQLNS